MRGFFITSSIQYGKCLLYLCVHTYARRSNHAALESSLQEALPYGSCRNTQVRLRTKVPARLGLRQVKSLGEGRLGSFLQCFEVAV